MNDPRSTEIVPRGEPETQPDAEGSLRQVGFAAYRGPLPPPELMERYEQVLPGTAERLLRMVEAEGEHRRELEAKHLQGQLAETSKGQWMAFLIGLFTIAVGAVTAAIYDKELAGALLGSGGVIGLVTVFIAGRKQSDD